MLYLYHSLQVTLVPDLWSIHRTVEFSNVVNILYNKPKNLKRRKGFWLTQKSTLEKEQTLIKLLITDCYACDAVSHIRSGKKGFASIKLEDSSLQILLKYMPSLNQNFQIYQLVFYHSPSPGRVWCVRLPKYLCMRAPPKFKANDSCNEPFT